MKSINVDKIRFEIPNKSKILGLVIETPTTYSLVCKDESSSVLARILIGLHTSGKGKGESYSCPSSNHKKSKW